MVVLYSRRDREVVKVETMKERLGGEAGETFKRANKQTNGDKDNKEREKEESITG